MSATDRLVEINKEIDSLVSQRTKIHRFYRQNLMHMREDSVLNYSDQIKCLNDDIEDLKIEKQNVKRDIEREKHLKALESMEKIPDLPLGAKPLKLVLGLP